MKKEETKKELNGKVTGPNSSDLLKLRSKQIGAELKDKELRKALAHYVAIEFGKKAQKEKDLLSHEIMKQIRNNGKKGNGNSIISTNTISEIELKMLYWYDMELKKKKKENFFINRFKRYIKNKIKTNFNKLSKVINAL